MRIQNLSASEVLQNLVSGDAGLPRDEAARRLSEYGFNEIRAVRRRSLARKLLAQFTHFLAVLLWVAAGLAFFSELFSPGEACCRSGLLS